MEKLKILQEISKGLTSLEEQLKNRIAVFYEMKINMQENLEYLQDSIAEVDKYISELKKNIEDEENIFFLGIGSNKNQRRLEEQENNRNEIIEHIKNMKKTIVVEEEKNKFIEDVSLRIIEYNKMINKLINQKTDKNKSILEQLRACQKLSKIDHERCFIEIGKIIEEVEKWEAE